MNATIFVTIASYCDPELPYTIKSLIERATSPSRVRLSIVDQCFPGKELTELTQYDRNISYLSMPFNQARGVGYARALAMQAYRGEAYWLQIDAHTQCMPGWDVWIEKTVTEAPCERSLFTAYPTGYTRQEDGSVVVEASMLGSVIAAAIMPKESFKADQDNWTLMPQGQVVQCTRPIPATNIAAGFLCGPGLAVEHFPYDPQIYFYGEEQSLMLRFFTHGWDVWHPVDLPFYHLYNTDKQDVRPVHWRATEDEARKVRWWEYEARSKQRLADLINGKISGVYGLGGSRTLADFAAFTGIDYPNRTLYPHAFTVRSA